MMPALTKGGNNFASGTEALKADTIGSNNIAFGIEALKSNIEGSVNIALGPGALAMYRVSNRRRKARAADRSHEPARGDRCEGRAHARTGQTSGHAYLSGSANVHQR